MIHLFINSLIRYLWKHNIIKIESHFSIIVIYLVKYLLHTMKSCDPKPIQYQMELMQFSSYKINYLDKIMLKKKYWKVTAIFS